MTDFLRKSGPFGAWVLVSLLLAFGLSASAAPGPDPEREAIVDAMRVVYVHGVDDALAAELRRQLGPRMAPVLRELLNDPAFPRRDNAVAFLAHLEGSGARQDLLDLLANPPAGWSTPEEERALLGAPRALGHLARHGDALAVDALLQLTDPVRAAGLLGGAARQHRDPAAALAALTERALFGLSMSGDFRARDRLVDVGLERIRFPDARFDLATPALQALDLMDELLSSWPGPTAGQAAGSSPVGAAFGEKPFDPGTSLSTRRSASTTWGSPTPTTPISATR